MAQQSLSQTLINLFIIRITIALILSFLFFGALDFNANNEVLGYGKNLEAGQSDTGLINSFDPNLRYEFGLLIFPDLSFITKFFNLVIMLFKYAIAFDITTIAYASALGIQNVTFFMLVIYYFPQIPLVFKLIGAILNRVL